MAKKTIYEDKVLRREIEMKAANDFEEKLSKDEISMCILTMERKRVSFFADHVWPNRRMGKLVWSLTADGRRSIAHQNGLAGMEPPEFEGEEDGHPLVCRVKVFRKMYYDNGRNVHLCAYHGEARWSEFVGLKRNGEVNAQWRQRPYNQLSKCAEMQALRRGFPEGELLDDSSDVVEHEDIHVKEEPATAPNVTPAPKPELEATSEPKPEPASAPEPKPEPVAVPEPEPEPKPKPEPEPEPRTVDTVKGEALPLLKAYCEKVNGGEALSWKAAYTKLAGVVESKAMELSDYETLMSCLRDALESQG